METALLITTINNLEGYKVKKQLGFVLCLTVRSRSVLGNKAGNFMPSLAGKAISILNFVKLQERKHFN